MSKKKIVILLEEHENIAKQGISLLKEKEYDLLFLEKNKNELLLTPEVLSSEAILVRGAIIESQLIENMLNLKVIARAGVGTDNIDIKHATKKGIYVCNTPNANFLSVAEHVIGLMISLSHQIVIGNELMKEGDFNARHSHIGSELKGKTIGIIGLGKIGKSVAQKCSYGFDMNVLAYDPYVKEKQDKKIKIVDSMDIMYKKADFISLHLPYTPNLHHFIDKSKLKK